MGRNNQHLTDRQAEFLNTLARGRMTTEEVERHLGMACHTLRRWMDEEAFMQAWAKTNRLLQLRRGADDAVRGKGARAAAGILDNAAAVEGCETASDRGADAAGGGTKPRGEGDAADGREDGDSGRPRRAREAAAARQPKSDRDLIRLRHGEEAARAFEALLRRHAAPAEVMAAPAPSPPPPPPGNPPD